MTSSTALLMMLVLAIGYAIWQSHRAENSCLYCGTYRSHTAECPYNQERFWNEDE